MYIRCREAEVNEPLIFVNQIAEAAVGVFNNTSSTSRHVLGLRSGTYRVYRRLPVQSPPFAVPSPLKSSILWTVPSGFPVFLVSQADN
ncbi:hypothetical protein ACOSP7_002547 [Xanthoceras sorbifolium]